MERLVPRDALEPPLALAPDALLRVQQPLRRVRPIEIPGDLRAQDAVGRRVLVGAGDPDRDAVANGRDERAGIGTVVRTGAAHGSGLDR